MKKIIVLLLLTAVFLSGCANHAAGTMSAPTPDKAGTPDSVTSAPTEPLTEPPTDPPPTLDELALSKFNKILNTELSSDRTELYAEEINQYPELPSGCEAVSLAVALNCLGYEVEKTEIVDDYLVYDDNFAIGYCGDPYREKGAGIYPPGLVRTAWNYINENGAELYPFDTTGLTMDELYRFIDAGYPVIVWTTVYMNWPYFDGGVEYDGVFYPWYDLEHCVCVYGYDTDSGEVMISDPQRGKITVSASRFSEIYDEIGRFSIVLIGTEDLKQS